MFAASRDPDRRSARRVVEPVAPRSADGFVDPIERDALKAYLNRQFVVLTHRHSVEQVILLRVLADYHQHAVLEAKNGFLAVARHEMHVLDGISLPDILELRLVNAISAEPAWALIDWLDSQCQVAERRLHAALRSCAELAADFGHDYLTGKQLTLAAHVGRMMISQGRDRDGLEHLTALGSVVRGAQGDWPFEGGDLLAVPLAGTERTAVEHLLRKTAILAVGNPSCPHLVGELVGQPDAAKADQ